MCDRGQCGKTSWGRGRDRGCVEVKHIRERSCSSPPRHSPDYNLSGGVTSASIAADKCCPKKKKCCSDKSSRGRGCCDKSRSRSRSSSRTRGCCKEKPCKKPKCKSCTKYQVIIKERRRSRSRGPCCRDKRDKCDKCKVKIIIKKKKDCGGCKKKGCDSCYDHSNSDRGYGGKGGCGRDSCGGCCQRQVQPNCLLKKSEVCGAQYAKPCPGWNVGDVPCSPCGNACAGGNGPCVFSGFGTIGITPQ